MRIAIAQCQGRVSPVFDFSNDLCLVDIENGREINRETRALMFRDPFRRAAEVFSSGAEVLICGALSRQMEMALTGTGIRTAGFICGDLEEVIAAFVHGTLHDGPHLMPGCASGRPRRRMRGHHRDTGAASGYSGGQTLSLQEENGHPCSRGHGRSGMGGRRVAGTTGEYVCRVCGFRFVHAPGQPHTVVVCPRCSSPVIIR